jgi:hypothetical protein
MGAMGILLFRVRALIKGRPKLLGGFRKKYSRLLLGHLHLTIGFLWITEEEALL